MGSTRVMTDASGSGTPLFNRSYTYDPVNRLATMSSQADPYGCYGLPWTYDAWGNRTDQTVTGGTCPAFHQSVDADNHLVGPPYQYDAAGNLTSDGAHTYTYDAENRITQVDGGSTASYVYNGEGERAQKTVSGVSTDYHYDALGRVLAEYDGGCGPTCWHTGYVYLNGRLAAEYSNSTTYFIMPDHLGSTRIMTGVDGSVADSLDFLPYGEQIAGDTTTTHKFTGKERDSESNLDNFGARYFGSSPGRFMSPDPLGILTEQAGDPQGLNLYSYVENNPANAVDPDGLDCTYVYDDDVGYNRGDCIQGQNGTYVNGTIDEKSFAYNSNTGTLSFNYTNRDSGAIGKGVIGNVYPSSGVSSSDLFNAVAQGANMAGYALSTPQRWYNAEQAWANRHPNIVAAVGIVGGLLVGGDEPMEEAPTGESPYGNTPEGRPLSKHYATETGPQRNIPGSVVDETINHPSHTQELGDRRAYYSSDNNVTVVVSKTTGKIMSVRKGMP
jgi:RHS repeat-associated protein